MTQELTTMDTVPVPMGGTVLPYADPAAVAAAESAKARIQAAYTMAAYKPRSFMVSRQRILDACMRPSFAGKVEYSKPVGTSKVKGPSIRFAELALREWGNVMQETQTIYEDDERRRILVRLVDLETNATFSKEIQLNKTVERKKGEGREVLRSRQNTNGETVFIVRATEDELLTKEAALVSKTIRNEGLRLIPQDIIEEALEKARMALRGGVKDPHEAVKHICDFFATWRINVEMLEEYLGHPMENVTWEEVDELRGMANAIKDGEAKWSDYVSPKDKGEKSAQGTAGTAADLKEKLGKAKKTEPAAAVQDKPAMPETITCPNSGAKVRTAVECGKCADNKECPELNGWLNDSKE